MNRKLLVLIHLCFFLLFLDFANADESLQKNTRSPIPLLFKQIKDSGDNNQDILKQLAATKPETTSDVDLLVNLYQTQGESIKKAAIKALRNVPPESAYLKPKYIQLLDIEDKDIQLVSMEACVQLNAKEAAPKILSLLANQPDHKIRPRFMAGVTEESLGFVHATAKALVDLDRFEAIDEIISRDEIMMINPQMVSEFGAKAMPKLVQLAKGNSHLKQGGYTAIAWMRDENATEQLTALLQDKDDQLITAAARALVEIGSKTETKKGEIETALNQQIGHTNQFVRAQVYAGLIVVNPGEYLPIAMQSIKKDQYIRMEILYALMRNPIPDAVPYLEEFIKWDELQRPNDTHLRIVAARVIYKASGKRIPYKGLEMDKRKYRDPYDFTKPY